MPNIPGAQSIVDWFGEWPSFHDAEIVAVHILRQQESSIVIRTFTTSDRTDDSGHFIRERDALVIFEFKEIRHLGIEGEDADAQNVIGGLTVEQVDDGYRLFLGPCYGMAGEIVAKALRVRLGERFTPD